MIPRGAGKRKAARIVLEARWRAGLGQTELARRAAVPVRTLTRIERAEVVPRLDTVERLLLACGRTLAVEVRICFEEAVQPPRSNDAHLGRILQGLRYLSSAAVSSVIVGRLASLFHGADDEPLGVEVLSCGWARPWSRDAAASFDSRRWTTSSRWRWTRPGPRG